MKTKRINILIVLSVTVIVVFFSKTRFIQDVEYRLYDRCLLSNQPALKSSNIALVGIDDTTLAKLGKWPLPRNYYAVLLNFLYYFPPSAVGFDILFTESDIINPSADISLGKLSEMMGNVCFGYYFGFKTLFDVDVSDNVQPVLISQRLPNVKGNITNLPDAKSYKLPIEQLRYNLGFLNAPCGEQESVCASASEDGTLRDVPLFIRFGNDIYPSFVLQLIRKYYKIGLKNIEVVINKEVVLYLPDNEPVKIPIDKSGRMMINYAGGLDSFTTISFEDILRGAQSLSKQDYPGFKPDMLKNTITLVGVTATGIDVGQLPLRERLSPLSLVHLNALRTITEQKFIKRIKYKWILLATVISIIVSAIISSMFSPVLGMLVFLLYIFGINAGYFFLIKSGIWFPVVPAVLGYAVTYLGVTCTGLISAEREKRRIKNMFGHYGVVAKV